MTMRALLALIVALACALPAAARPSVPIVDYYNQPIAGATTIDSVRRAITTAAAGRKWTITESGAGHMIATLVIRSKHTLVIDIRYNTSMLDLRYRDSENLNYHKFDNGGRVIHPNYNNEVKALFDAINAALQQQKTG